MPQDEPIYLNKIKNFRENIRLKVLFGVVDS